MAGVRAVRTAPRRRHSAEEPTWEARRASAIPSHTHTGTYAYAPCQAHTQPYLLLQVSAVIGARMGTRGKREYLVVWTYETEEGEQEETWEPYHHLMVKENGEMAIHPETEKQVSAAHMYVWVVPTSHKSQFCCDSLPRLLPRLLHRPVWLVFVRLFSDNSHIHHR